MHILCKQMSIFNLSHPIIIPKSQENMVQLPSEKRELCHIRCYRSKEG